ncbi:MAG: DUF3095 domain-containing protein [Longimicrobiales bacterium]
MTSDSFYRSIEPVDSFEQLAFGTSYAPLPDDWWVVAADVKNSTAAIDGGRYKHVNTVGVSVIAAIRNAAPGVEVPYVFGGDGAVVCVPERFVPECRRALSATMAMAQASFDLTLRACVAPVSWVRDQGLDVLVARHRVSAHYVQCALFGGGAAHVERGLKRGGLPNEFVLAADADAQADYTGLECRWSEIPSPHDETVAVIVDATGPQGEALEAYRDVMERIRGIYGEADDCRPVAEAGLRVSLARKVLDNEIGLRGWRMGALGRFLRRTRLRADVVIGWILLRFGMRWGDTDWGTYRSDLVANTDFRKFDGSLRLVLSGTAAQREQLEAYLLAGRNSGRLHFGVHVAKAAVMTCLIEERQGAHFHFVDGAGGGYAAAALALKASVARAQGVV